MIRGILEASSCYYSLTYTVLLRMNAGGVHLIIDIFFFFWGGGGLFKGGVYMREAFITKYRNNSNSIYQRQ